MREGGIRRSGKYGIGMNPHGTIGSNFPQGNRPGRFGILEPLKGVSNFSDRITLWHAEAISENLGRNRL